MILLGLVHLVRRGFRRPGGALFWILLGVLLQVDRLELFPWWRFERLWPVLLIVAGLVLLLGRLRLEASLANRRREGRIRRHAGRKTTWDWDWRAILPKKPRSRIVREASKHDRRTLYCV